MAQDNRTVRRVLVKAATLVLLFGIVGVSIVAKTNARLPRCNPAHYTSSSIKMEPTQPSAILERAPLHRVASLAPETAMPREARRDETELPPLNQAVLTSSVQHRSPPPTLA